MNTDAVGLGKLLIISGIVLIGFGVIMVLTGKFNGFPKLPGDILIKKDNFTFYFPIVSSILISILLTLIFYVIKKFK